MINYLTTATATTTYQPISLMSNYLTTATASTTYQLQSNMINYLTTATATTTYQPISLMSNYLTTATASTTYQLQSNMINYLTTATAGTTYQLKTDMINYVNTSGIQSINGVKTFGSLPECSNGSPTLDNQLVNKFYVDRLPIHITVSGIISNLSIYQLKSDMVNYLTVSSAIYTYQPKSDMTNYVNTSGNQAINGIKTFSNNTEFTGTNGYFIINCGMGSGTLNPASQNGTIGIIGLKDQINDKVLLTLYGNTHVSVKLSFTGVSMGFGGGGQIPNTSVTCDGTYVIIKPSIKFNGDNTIQNSAFTGAGTLSGTYNLSNITIDANGKITSLSSGLTSNNNFTGINNFSSNINCSSSINLTDIGNFSSILATIQQNSASLNIENPSLGSTIRLKTRPSVGAVQNSLTLNTASCDILSPTLNLTGASPISILTPNNLNGTINLFNNLTTGTININSSTGNNIINGNVTINNDLISNSPATFLDYIITNTGLKWVDVTPSANYVESRVLGTALGFIPSFNLNSYEFYTNDSAGNPSIPVTITDDSTTFNHQLICNNGAVFNTTLPTSTITAINANELVNYTTLTGQGFTTLALVRSSTNNFTGFNTFSSGLTIRSTLLLKDTANVLEGSIDLISGGLLNISCSVNSGKIILNTHDSTGNSYNRLFVNENEVNITAPLTLSVDYSYYNPGVFNSTRLGYSMSNTGSTNTLTNNNVNNSGRINIPAGSWNISYTTTLTVISATLTTLKSLEVYVGNSALNDLNIIGINVLNYYNTSSVPIGQKIKISGSGNYISYTNVSTELNLLILPLFTSGLAGLTFQGKISATRNA